MFVEIGTMMASFYYNYHIASRIVFLSRFLSPNENNNLKECEKVCSVNGSLCICLVPKILFYGPG